MPSRKPDPQLSLFPLPGSEALPVTARRPPPSSAPVAPETVAAARSLPALVRLGTSSWSFPGWAGIVYDREHSTQRLARDGLAAYARHPLFATVGIDRSYYAPLRAEELRAYAEAVPERFRFVVKAHEVCTLARFPTRERYGAQKGQLNSLFLDPAYAAAEIIGPLREGLGEKAGPLVFQFPPQSVAEIGGAAGFADRLHRFLAALPGGTLYAVEIRNRELLTRAYTEALADTGACPCLNVHPSMPGVAAQAARFAWEKLPALVLRWMLGGRRGYDEARARYQPFDRLVDEDPRTRGAIARLCSAHAARNQSVFVTINNKAEGSAPLSAIRLAEAIAALGSAEGEAGATRSGSA